MSPKPPPCPTMTGAVRPRALQRPTQPGWKMSRIDTRITGSVLRMTQPNAEPAGRKDEDQRTYQDAAQRHRLGALKDETAHKR